LPSHEDYRLEKNKVIVTTIENDIKQLRQRLEDVALWIDLDVYHCKNDQGDVIGDDLSFHADKRDEGKRSKQSMIKKVTFSDKVATLAIQSKMQDFGHEDGCPTSITSSSLATASDQSLGKLDLWIHRDPDLDIVNLSTSSDGSSFSDYDSQNWATFEHFTQNGKDSLVPFDTPPFPPLDSPNIISKKTMTKIPPSAKESTARLRSSQRRRKLVSFDQIAEPTDQDQNDLKTSRHQSSPSLLFDVSFGSNASCNDSRNDHLDVLRHDFEDMAFDPTHSTTVFLDQSDLKRDLFGAHCEFSSNLQEDNPIANDIFHENQPLSNKLFTDQIQKEPLSALDATSTSDEEERHDKIDHLEMFFSDEGDTSIGDASNSDYKKVFHSDGLTPDHSDLEQKQISSSFSEWDDSFFSESNFSFNSRSHSSNHTFTSFDSPDDIDDDADNFIRTKIEMFSDEYSQSIDSSRLSKSTSSTADTDTMTTEDDIETSWCRVSKKIDCDVGCELDYLESKVKDFKTKQDRNVTHGIISATISSSSVPDKSEASIKDLKSGEGRIVRLKTLSTSKKFTARLSYENDMNIPHDEMDELDLAPSSDVHTKKNIQTENRETPPSTSTKNVAKTSHNLTAARLRALKATSAWKRRYGTDDN
jgi:hypothetical protein